MLGVTDKFKNEKQVCVSFVTFLFASMLVSFTVVCLVNLQSSLNIEDGLGEYELSRDANLEKKQTYSTSTMSCFN